MSKISVYPAGLPVQASDKFINVRAGNNYAILGAEFLPAPGTMHNGKISVTVASNNLTLALKTAAGADPSATDPVLAFIGGAWRAITAPLSVTKNAGFSYMGLGSAETAAQETDLFAYLGYNATDGVVVIAHSRISYATIYSDFSTSITNAKYAAISTITNAAATDEYMVIGRFAATLSGLAGYTWSVPAYTASNLIQHPIYETRVLTFAPQPTNFVVGSGTLTGKYQFIGRHLWHRIEFTMGAGSSVSGQIAYTAPFSVSSVYSFTHAAGIARLYDSNPGVSYAGLLYAVGGATMWILAQALSGSYLAIAATSSTVPFTWATNDQFSAEAILQI